MARRSGLLVCIFHPTEIMCWTTPHSSGPRSTRVLYPHRWHFYCLNWSLASWLNAYPFTSMWILLNHSRWIYWYMVITKALVGSIFGSSWQFLSLHNCTFLLVMWRWLMSGRVPTCFTSVWLIQVSSPASSSSPWSINSTAPYFWISQTAIAISAQLFLLRWRIARMLVSRTKSWHRVYKCGRHNRGILLLYLVFTLIFLIPLALDNPILNPFIQFMGKIGNYSGFEPHKSQ